MLKHPKSLAKQDLFGSVMLAGDGELQQLAVEEDPGLSEAKTGGVKRIFEVGLKRIISCFAKMLKNRLLFFRE